MVTEPAAPGLYLDEDVPYGLRDRLQEMGLDVRVAQEELPLGTADSRQLKSCADNSWVIITINRSHFERLHRLWKILNTWDVMGTDHGGIISVSEGPQNPPLAHEWASRIFELVTGPDGNLIGSMWVWYAAHGEWRPVHDR